MHRNLFLLFAMLALGWGVSAQSGIALSVVAGAGESSQNGKTRLEWTLGETAVATLATPYGLLTEGFHQPEILRITKMDTTKPETGSTAETAAITLAPNPVSTQFTLNVPAEWSDEISRATLFDAWGKPVALQQISPGASTSVWDMSAQPAGTYWLRIVTQDARQQTFKVVKIY